ncbi:hypothetical protein ASG29_10875 [Sphingomonas sp. Leaf412]|uniref:DUF3667 domain-containing protein n=1 Tax=Sphingomonas sp. Leaf412 TaxID=1736370 RepID=UPI0006F54436|nr:DUF3667 domain-containing protein [Sphingomonas sp. Leaf412]KQT32307.1 hypothetical protein ASG29_10875 [Sphingomonas sp. Leaf412]
MTGEIEAIGDIATGGAVAHALEPHGAGRGAHGGLCRNCGTRLIGAHCHECGQAGHVHRTIGAFGHDILHGVFHFEGKIWRTLPLLALHPGRLTRRYIDGERVRFVSPMAMFLFSVFLMFAVVANLPTWTLGDPDFLKGNVSDGMTQARARLGQESAKAAAAAVAARQALARERADATPDGARIAKLERRVADAQAAQRDLSDAARALPADADDARITTRLPSAQNWLETRWKHARENPKLVLYKIKTGAYKYSWALIPISLPFIWLLFPLRRDVSMYDHAVFATYSLTFMSLLTIVLAVLGAIGLNEGVLWTAALLIPPVHLYRQLKDGYLLSRGGALWRTFLMLNFAVFTTTFFILLLLYLGVD